MDEQIMEEWLREIGEEVKNEYEWYTYVITVGDDFNLEGYLEHLQD